jgi:hypothetical protein
VHDLRMYLDWPINSISGRLTELRDNYFMIEECGKRKMKGHNATVWNIISPDRRMVLIQNAYVQAVAERDQLVNDFQDGLMPVTKDLIQKKLNKLNDRISKLAELW